MGDAAIPFNKEKIPAQTGTAAAGRLPLRPLDLSIGAKRSCRGPFFRPIPMINQHYPNTRIDLDNLPCITRADRSRSQGHNSITHGKREYIVRFEIQDGAHVFNAGIEVIPEPDGCRDFLRQVETRDDLGATKQTGTTIPIVEDSTSATQFNFAGQRFDDYRRHEIPPGRKNEGGRSPRE